MASGGSPGGTRVGQPTAVDRPPPSDCIIERTAAGARVTVESATLHQLFVDAARVLVGQLGVHGPARAMPDVHQLSIVAADTEELLLIWLDEIILRSRQADRLFSETMMFRITPHRLRAELRAEHETYWLADVTSAVVTGARVEWLGGRFLAQITLALAPPPRTGSA